MVFLGRGNVKQELHYCCDRPASFRGDPFVRPRMTAPGGINGESIHKPFSSFIVQPRRHCRGGRPTHDHHVVAIFASTTACTNRTLRA
jgi:hypothetical protein